MVLSGVCVKGNERLSIIGDLERVRFGIQICLLRHSFRGKWRKPSTWSSQSDSDILISLSTQTWTANTFILPLLYLTFTNTSTSTFCSFNQPCKTFMTTSSCFFLASRSVLMDSRMAVRKISTWKETPCSFSYSLYRCLQNTELPSNPNCAWLFF